MINNILPFVENSCRLCFRKIKLLCFCVFRCMPIKDNFIVLESEGDCCDNSYALYEFMQDTLINYKFIWMVENPDKFTNTNNVIFVHKNNRIHFIKTIYYLSRSKYIFFDHCNLMQNYSKRKGQIVVNLWHGSPIKDTTAKEHMKNVDFVCSTSKFFNKLTAKFVIVDEKIVYDLGYPRNDYFFRKINDKQLWVMKDLSLNRYKKVLFWMPTFRRSDNKELDEIYFSSSTGLPVIVDEDELNKFNDLLKENNVLCVFKIHHLQSELRALKKKYSNIVVINDEYLQRINIQLYEFIKLSDALITDYSSVFIDYLLLDKPIIFTLDDYEEYKHSRGFIIEDPKELFAGYHVYQPQDLYKAVEEIVEGIDKYQIERHNIIDKCHTNKDGESSRRILEYSGLMLNS